MPRFEIEEGLQAGSTGLVRLPRLRLVGRAILIRNQVQCRSADLEIAKQNMRAQKAKDAYAHVDVADPCIGRFGTQPRAHESRCRSRPQSRCIRLQ